MVLCGVIMKVKDLDVKVKYEVGLGDLEMPENVYKQLVEACEDGYTIQWGDSIYPEASEWLSDNIREQDACDGEIEITDIS